MSQELIFTFAPYIAIVLMALGAAFRLRGNQNPEILSEEKKRARHFYFGTRVWRVGITVTLLGHVVGLALPGQILLFNQHPARLVVLEATGMVFAALALIGLLSHLRSWLRDTPEASLPLADQIFLVLLAVLLVSGLGVALLHRWASSWSMVTVVPYLHSVLRFAPEATGMASLPYLMRLHTLCFFILLPVWPWSSLGAFLARAGSGARAQHFSGVRQCEES